MNSYILKNKLESICKLYCDLQEKENLVDSLIHADSRGFNSSWGDYQKDVQKLIDKVKEYDLEDVSIFKTSITKLKVSYELK